MSAVTQKSDPVQKYKERECCYIHESGSFCIHMDIPPLDQDPVEETNHK